MSQPPQPNDAYLLLRAFVDELARCGMRAACTSPGSRCAPLVLSLAGEQRLRCYSHVDERCAGFFALGLAKASRLPVAVACTSGTAAAELLPAAIEAREARVPLLLLTADRPVELREVGAGQAIDQVKLFGGAAKWFFEVGAREADHAALRWIRTLACRAYWTALEQPSGVVHLNFPLREPLVPDGELGADGTGRAQGRPYVRRVPPAGAWDVSALGERLAGARRGVLIAGRHERAAPLGSAAADFAEAYGWPLLADPLSGARRGRASVAHYDALLRDARFAAGHEPDLVLRVGDLPVSKALRTWLAGLEGAPQVVLDPDGAWQDPASVLAESVAVDPAQALAELARGPAAAARETAQAGSDWLESWRGADERAAQAILGVLGDGGRISEPAVAAELGELLPAQATLFVASSMPVREIESFWPARDDPPRVLCNRGASGIDGTVSAAFGAAANELSAERRGGPVLLLIGDVALAHDVGGLLAARRLGLELTIVLLNNGGGAIFDFLPLAHAPMARRAASSSAGATGAEEIYELHIATPTGLDFAAAAELYGLAHRRPRDVREFRESLEWALGSPGTKLIEVAGDRTANRELHERVHAAVSAALAR